MAEGFNSRNLRDYADLCCEKGVTTKEDAEKLLDFELTDGQWEKISKLAGNNGVE